MSRFVIPSALLNRLRNDLLVGEVENCAILFGRSCEDEQGELRRFLVREPFLPQNDDYAIRTRVNAQLKPEFVAQVGQRARKSGESVVFVHTHPFSFNEFSETDDRGEVQLAQFLQERAPNARHAALLLTPEVSLARELGRKIPLRLVSVGSEISWSDVSKWRSNETRYDRQVRAFGQAGQEILRSIRVGIVGLGGTGSAVLQSLAYLGVRDFVLLDPDTIEETNLNRLIGARPNDVGRLKVETAKSWVEQIHPDAQIDARSDSVLKMAVARSLIDVDFLFCCTDSHGSRAVLNQLSYQYLIPAIDMGVAITVKNGKVKNIVGRTQMLAPGLACMVCGNQLDAEEIRRDLLTDFERKNDPYIVGEHEPAPAVITLNNTIASLATTMFLNAVVGIPGTARFINYNAMTGACRPAYSAPHPSCIVCSSLGAIGRGNEWPLPARQD